MNSFSLHERLRAASTESVNCLVCDADDFKALGIRGNREYTGADPDATPHLVTDVVECRNCGFIYTNPQFKGVEFLEAEHYNDPDEYQADGGEHLSAMYRHRIEYIGRFAPRGSLLDVGAAKGDFVKHAQECGFQACGIEPSPRFAAFAISHNNVPVYNGDLRTSRDLNGKTFDVITMHHVLEHVEEPHSLLETIKGYLNPGGVLYIEVPNTQSITSKVIDLYFRLRGRTWSGRLSPLHPPFHKFGYNPKSLSYLLNQHQYEISEMTTFSGFARGFGGSNGRLLSAARSAVIATVDLLGNRDMLVAVARPSVAKVITE